MRSETVWDVLDKTVTGEKLLWGAHESKINPSVLDQLIYYMISYVETPSVARKSVRIFVGIEGGLFAGWDEVRVSTLREIIEVLTKAGATDHSWELAVSLKDFLSNSWDLLFTLNLGGISRTLKPSEIVSYLDQLEGKTLPYRPKHSLFDRKKVRATEDPILPTNIIDFLKKLWGRSRSAPFEHHSKRFLERLGIIKKSDTTYTKTIAFKNFMGTKKLTDRHYKLVQFSKLVCTVDPRCDICPMTECVSRR